MANKKALSFESAFLFGAGSRGRTDTVSLPLDFESSTSANSIIPANKMYYTISKQKNQVLFRFFLKKFKSERDIIPLAFVIFN